MEPELHQCIGPHRGEVQWIFLGMETSRVCFAKFLGIGKHRLRKAAHGELDLRLASTGSVTLMHLSCCIATCCFFLRPHKNSQIKLYLQASCRPGPQYRRIDQFLFDLYIGAAGMLPHKFLGPN